MKKYSIMTFPKRKFFPPKPANLRCSPEMFILMYYYLGKLGIKAAKHMMNLPFYIPLDGPIDVKRFEDSIRKLIDDEPLLRTYISKEKGKFYLVEKENYEFHLKVTELEGRNAVEKIKRSREIFNAEANKDVLLFDPDSEQTRFELLRIDDEHHVFLFICTHIFFDFGGLTSTLSRLFRYYNGGEQPKQKLSTFGEFIEEETAFLKTQRGAEEMRYWKELVNGYEKCVLKKEKNSRQYWKPEDSMVYFDNSYLESIAKRGKTSVFNNSLLALQMAYAKYTQSYDSLAVYPISNRSEEKYRNTAGMLVRMLLNRMIFDKDTTIAELQKQQRKQLGEGYLNHHVAVDLGFIAPLLVVDESMGDISGDLMFNGKPIDLTADANIDSIMNIFPSGMVLVMINPAGDQKAFNLLGNLKYYGRHYKHLKENLILAFRFMDRYPDKTFGEFMRSDVTLETVDLIEDPEQIELIAI